MATERETVESDDSLIALTSHFAQVQFRLKQIISAEAAQKEELLKELEQFAFQGCGGTGQKITYDTAASDENGSMESQQKVRVQLMKKLHRQLHDIERCAKEAAVIATTTKEEEEEAEDPSSSSITDKQRIIIEELRKRFHFQFEGDLSDLSTEEIKVGVDKAVKQVVDPIRTKDSYVGHLEGQIKDLERYITFLQAKQTLYHTDGHASPSHDSLSHDHTEYSDEDHLLPYASHDVKQKRVTFSDFAPPEGEGLPAAGCEGAEPPVPEYEVSMMQLDGVSCTLDFAQSQYDKTDNFRKTASGNSKGPDDLRLSLLLMRKTLAIMEVMTLCQCGGSLQCLPKYVADGKRKRYHAALRSLEMTIDKIAIITASLTEPNLSKDSKVSLETDLHETVSMSLADSLRVLLEHGLIANGHHISLTASCFPAWSVWGRSLGVYGSGQKDCPAWKVLMYYYKIKNGGRFSSRTEQLLKTSFDLPSNSTSAKKTLLSSIHKVDQMYKTSPRRSLDTKFRAFISEGFNLGHLSDWFKVLSSNPSICDDLYISGSFLTTTGFRPAIACLERLRDNPGSVSVVLPRSYFHHAEAFLAS